MTDVDTLLVALASGETTTIRSAAMEAGMRPRDALDAAREHGWPDRDSIRLAADAVRERLAVPDPHDADDYPPHDLSGEEPMPPRTKPVEPDVEAVMQARTGSGVSAALASSVAARDAAADEALTSMQTPEDAAPPTGTDRRRIIDTTAPYLPGQTLATRASAARCASDILRARGCPTYGGSTGHVDEIITLAEWIVNGTRPAESEGRQ